MRIGRLLKVEGLWSLINLLRDAWPSLLALALGGSGLSYLAAITGWMQPYGPNGWGLAFFVGAFLALGLMYIWTVIASRRFANRQVELSVTTTGVNPRERRFEKQRLQLASFYSEFHVDPPPLKWSALEYGSWSQGGWIRCR